MHHEYELHFDDGTVAFINVDHHLNFDLGAFDVLHNGRNYHLVAADDCSCGEHDTPNVVHRLDGPCYHVDAAGGHDDDAFQRVYDYVVAHAHFYNDGDPNRTDFYAARDALIAHDNQHTR